jgi:hypothetical protein
VDVAIDRAIPLAESARAVAETLTFGAVDVSWTPPLRNVVQAVNENDRYAGASLKPSDGLEPSTPSLPWRERGVTRVHARSFSTQFLLQFGLIWTIEMCRETTRVSFLMCPSCVRALLTSPTTARFSRPKL